MVIGNCPFYLFVTFIAKLTLLIFSNCQYNLYGYFEPGRQRSVTRVVRKADLVKIVFNSQAGEHV